MSHHNVYDFFPDFVDGEALFLNHVPYEGEDLYPQTFDSEYSDDDIHDSIVKLPGRFYPKLPYTSPDNNQARKYNNNHDTNRRKNVNPLTGPIISPLRSNININNNKQRIITWEDQYDTPIRLNDQQDQYPNHLTNSKTSTTEPPASGGPRFDRTMDRNVTAVVGDTVELVCRVISLGDLTVSCSIKCEIFECDIVVPEYKV